MKKALIISLSINCLLVLFFIGKRYYYSYGAGAGRNTKSSFYDQWDNMRNSVYAEIKIDTADIVFIGNSLTEGFPVTEIYGQRVINRGIGGNQTSHIIKRLPPIAAKRPSKLFIEAGVNDLNAGINVDSIFKNYRQIIDIIRDTAPTTCIYVQSVFPTSKDYTNINSGIVQLNKLLSAYCNEIGVKYIDIYNKMVNAGQLNNTLTEDGIHLNGKGYAIWKEAIEKYVQ